jgi:hypothetical protein
LQFVTTKTEGWRNRILSKNKSKEEIEVATTKDSQLHLLIDTPIARFGENLRSSRTNFHWPFVGAGSGVIEGGWGRTYLIPQRHGRHHLTNVAREPNLKENKRK